MTYSLDTILNATHDALIMIDGQGCVTLLNDAAEKLLNIKREDIMGRYIKEVIPGSRLPDVLESGQPELNKQVELEDTTIITNRMPVKDEAGNLIGALAVFRDITEILQMERVVTDLREMESMLRSILHFAQDAISVVDQEGNGLYINPAYTRLTGLSEQDVIGKPAHVDIAEGDSMHMKALRTRKPVYNATLKVGFSKKDVLVNVMPIIIQGELKGSVAVIYDMSELLELQEELQQTKQIIRKLEAKHTFADLIAEDPMMQEVVDKAKRGAATLAPVLLRGELGTGKELFAHSIHHAGDRKFGRFVHVYCMVIPIEKLEYELFGCENDLSQQERKGTYKGLIEEADQGTIFLDEIGQLPLSIQEKLLKLLQDKTICRMGSMQSIPVDVRVIASTSIHLEKAVEEKRFREDLYYRMNAITILIPPLRHHKSDILPLCRYFLQLLNQDYGRAVQELSLEALDCLLAYDWPGNSRELKNILERAMIHMKLGENVIQKKHLSDNVQGIKTV